VCLPAIAAKQSLLPQAGCAGGNKCAPCFDPTAPDPTAPTGACDTACDSAKEPPVVLTCPWTGPPVGDPTSFPACSPACNGAHCVPASQVPAAQQSQLATCAGGFCLPDPLISTAGNYVPPACTPIQGAPAEGRCLSKCLPAVVSQASQLVQDTCGAEELCVPCYDPFTAASTGACTTTCDQPTQPPYTFPPCCDFNGSSQGTCLPQSKVPADQQANLLQDTCPASFLCVPDEYLPNPTVPISTCSGLLGTGACVSECTNVPGIFGQNDCPDNHLCVSCLFAPSTPGCQ